MKKKSKVERIVLCALFTLALIVGLQPFAAVSSWADTALHSHQGWTAWSSSNSLPTTEGKYYLTRNVTLDSTWSAPTGDTTLCLNGFGIISGECSGSLISVSLGKTLTLCDCRQNSVTHRYKVASNDNFLAQVNDDLAANYKTFEGGYIAGGSGTRGGAINSSGTLRMENITIIGNKATQHGGGLFIGQGRVDISDCKFLYNNSYSQANYGGAIAMAMSKDTYTYDEKIADSYFLGNFSAYGGAIQGTTQNSNTTH